MKALREKKLLIAAVVIVLLSGVMLLARFLSPPEFPESVPSAEQLDVRSENYKIQVEFFNRLTRYLRENHGGLIEAEEIDKNLAVEGDKGYTYVIFRHRYKYIDDELIIKLLQGFSKTENIGYKIKKFSYTDKSLKKPDSYEIVFQKESLAWISVKLEWADDAAYQQKRAIQYTEITDEIAVDLEEPQIPEVKKSDQPTIIIIIDDFGYTMEMFNQFIQLDYEITYSILPQLPFSLETAEQVHRAGYDVMLHLPMQPKDWPRYNPGEGALLITDSDEIVRQKMDLNFKTVPYAVGVNNHMGSAYTQYSEGLNVLMKILNGRQLFFIDSKTAPGNTARNAARNQNVAYYSRNIFLDNIQEESYVRTQLYKAVNIAKKRGKAIAIGHPYQVTYNVLAKHLPEIESNGASIAGVSYLLR